MTPGRRQLVGVARGLPLALLAAALVACGGGGGSRLGVSQVPPDVVYQGPIYGIGQLQANADLAYSQRPNPDHINYTDIGTKGAEKRQDTLTLKLDVWVPPNATAAKPQPLVITVHGGAFTAGSKTDDANAFPISYARAGYVAAAINYRLTEEPDLNATRRVAAQRMALEDLQNAVRYLRVHAATYHIDPTRIAVIGSSAGGALALMNAADADNVDNAGPTTDYPGVSAGTAAAVSTGATLIDVLVPDSYKQLTFDAGDTPNQMFHANPADPFTKATWAGNVLPTQKFFSDVGVTSVVVATPGSQHTVPLGVQANGFWDDLFPFLKQQLRLSALQ